MSTRPPESILWDSLRGSVVTGALALAAELELARALGDAVRASARDRLVLLETVIEPGNEPQGAKWLDLLMLTIAAGKERTEAHWRSLLDDTDWEPSRFGAGVIEAQPCP